MARRRSSAATTESTPLLREVHHDPIDDGAVEQQRAAQDAEVAQEETMIAQEATGKKLVVILASVYLGVFLGALGIHTQVDLVLEISLQYNERFHDHRHARDAHIGLFPFVYADLVDRVSVFDSQCRATTLEREAYRHLWQGRWTHLLEHLLPRREFDMRGS